MHGAGYASSGESGHGRGVTARLPDVDLCVGVDEMEYRWKPLRTLDIVVCVGPAVGTENVEEKV